MKKINLLFVILIAIVFTGCGATYFHVNVNSIGNSLQKQNTYVLFSGNKDTDVNSLEFKEYAKYVNNALKEKGFIETSFKKASIAIFVSYGIGEPKENNYSYSTPIYGQTGYSSSRTTGTVNTYGNNTSYSGTTTYTPTYGVTGSQSHSGVYITYFRYLILDATDLNEYKKTKKQIQLWKTTVTSTGSSGDLRQVIPILVGASKNYIGSNTGKKLLIKITEDDKRVLTVKGIKEK